MALISANSIGFSPPQKGCQLSGLISLNARKMRNTSQNAASAWSQTNRVEVSRRPLPLAGVEEAVAAGRSLESRSCCSTSRLLDSSIRARCRSPTDGSDSHNHKDNPDGPEAEELEAGAQPDWVCGGNQGHGAGESPAVVREHWEQQSGNWQTNRQEDQQQDDPD